MSDFQSNPSNPHSGGPFHRYVLLPPRAMDGEEIHKLWCLVDGDTVPFEVRAGLSFNIDNLKEMIWFKKNLLCKVAAPDLVLWKLNDPEPVDPQATLAERIRKKGDVTAFATTLTAAQEVSTLFPQQPPKGRVHIFVQLPSTNSRPLEPSIPSPPLNASPRSDTVAALYQRLKKYAFIQVRGTPASGKTVLAQLLAQHISRQDPGVHVIWVDGWPLQAVGNYRSYLKQKGWVEHEKTVFIFDEAQLTYEDPQLWGEFFKSMHDYEERRAIVFASYGNPMSCIGIKGTRMMISDPQQVTLHHVAHEDGLSPVGLLFTRSEFNDLVIKHYPSSFDSSFFDALFDMTNGHVGAFQDFISIIIADDSYRKLNRAAGQLYTWNTFLAEVSLGELLRKLDDSANIFRRGLPSGWELHAPATASIFSAVLCNKVVMDADFTTDDEKRALQRCSHNGWLHADKLVDLPDDVGYFFPSSLHRWCVEWKLLDSSGKFPQLASS